MSHYRLKLTPLSPIHVGSGEMLEPYAYYLQDQRVHSISLPRLIERLSPIARDKYFRALAEGPLQARDELSTIMRSLPVQEVSNWQATSSEGFRTYTSNRSEKYTSKLEVRLLPRNPQGAYLPGSSLKGALRTALLASELDKQLGQDTDLGYYRDQWQMRSGKGKIVISPGQQRKRGLGVKVNQQLEAHTLGYLKEGRASILADPLRSLSIGDSGPIPQTHFSQIEVWGSRKSPEAATGISLLAEVWEQGSVEATLRINEGLQTKNTLGMRYKPDLELIAHSAFDRYYDLALDEKDIAADRQWDDAEDQLIDILDKLDELVSDGELRPPYRFPIRLGFGAGATTLHLAEFTGENPTSRKLCEGKPLGWLLAEVI